MSTKEVPKPKATSTKTKLTFARAVTVEIVVGNLG